WDVSAGALFKLLKGHSRDVWGATFSPDGRSILSYSDDFTARLWDVATGEGRALSGHQSTVWDAVFSPDGTRIATASGDREVFLWWDVMPQDPQGLSAWLSRYTSLTAPVSKELAQKTSSEESHSILVVAAPKPARLYRQGSQTPLGSTPFLLTLPRSEE